MMYTVLVREEGEPFSTTHITAQEATNVDEAKVMALHECAADWGRDSLEGLAVLGVLMGDVEVLEWDDGI